MTRPLLDLSGQRFDRLTVVGSLGRTPSGQRWLCSCDCGGIYGFRVCITTQLKNYKTSIGCKQCETERRSENSHMRSHGHCKLGKTKHYNVWKNMISRCRDKGNTSYKWYGAKGIDVCQEWKESYSAFYDWSMTNGYAEGLEIDRINPFKDYSPDNCRWITHADNMKNLRVHNQGLYHG